VALFRDILTMALVVVVVVAGVRLFFQPYEVDGASMAPELASGERLFVNRTAYSTIWLPGLGEVHPFDAPQRGDIVVLESDLTRRDAPYIKRIIALPGETIAFSEGLVFIDGEPLVEDYIAGAITACRGSSECGMTIPEGHVFVLGDNRLDSEDSRSFGPVPMADIVGKAFFSNWPSGEIGPIAHPDYGEFDLALP
jgi:signal peptidase I